MSGQKVYPWPMVICFGWALLFITAQTNRAHPIEYKQGVEMPSPYLVKNNEYRPLSRVGKPS